MSLRQRIYLVERKEIMFLNTLSLEPWKPKQPDYIFRRVEVVKRYAWDGKQRVEVKILEGPEKGRVVSSLSPSNLHKKKPRY